MHSACCRSWTACIPKLLDRDTANAPMPRRTGPRILKSRIYQPGWLTPGDEGRNVMESTSTKTNYHIHVAHHTSKAVDNVLFPSFHTKSMSLAIKYFIKPHLYEESFLSLR